MISKNHHLPLLPSGLHRRTTQRFFPFLAVFLHTLPTTQHFVCKKSFALFQRISKETLWKQFTTYLHMILAILFLCREFEMICVTSGTQLSQVNREHKLKSNLFCWKFGFNGKTFAKLCLFWVPYCNDVKCA